jgi:predicted PurR-regulated permease PerM
VQRAGKSLPAGQALRNDGRFALSIEGAQPLSHVAGLWRTTAQAATIGIFALMVIAALYLGRSLLLPVTAAFVVGFMLGPLSNWARRRGVPAMLTGVVLWLLVIGLVYGIIALLAGPVIDWVKKAPDIAANVRAKLHLLDQPLAMLRDLRDTILPPDKNRPQANIGLDLVGLLQPMLTVVTPAIGQVLIFFGVLFFVLLGRTQMRQVIVLFYDDRDARLRMLRILNDIERNLTTYLSVMAMINVVVGLIATGIAVFVGLPNPVAWGVLAFLLNFIPYIGALIMEAGMLAVGLVTFPGLTQALIAPAAYLGFAVLEGHFVTPSIMGKRLTLNPLTVILALVFWSWLWGPFGAFLAVPLLIVALVVARHLFPDDVPDLPG